MVTTTLLIDGDIEVYRIAHKNQEAFEWSPGIVAPLADLDAAKQEIDNWLVDLQEKLDAKRTRVALTGTDTCWRLGVLPTYKHNRVDTPRPLLYQQLREYLVQVHKAKIIPHLEADDVLGLWMTTNSFGPSIIVSGDKDLLQVPGRVFNPDKPDRGVVEVSTKEANRFHMTQTLTGDRVDGYYGCPGVGPKTAEKILKNCTTLKEGWEAVVKTYESKDLTEKDALVQARVARILRKGEYNPKKRRVKLWEAPRRAKK